MHLCRYAVQAKEDGEGDVFYCHFSGVRELEKGTNRCPSLGLGEGWSHSWVAPVGTQLWCLKRTLYRVSYRGSRYTDCTEDKHCRLNHLSSSPESLLSQMMTSAERQKDCKRKSFQLLPMTWQETVCTWLTDKLHKQRIIFFHVIISFGSYHVTTPQHP